MERDLLSAFCVRRFLRLGQAAEEHADGSTKLGCEVCLASERGAILVYAAVVMLPLIGCTMFAVDYGILLVGRGQAQNAADAAALAGATTLLHDMGAHGATNINDPTLESAARANAIYMAKENLVVGQSPDVLPADVTFPVCPPGSPPGKCIRVDVFRNQARN